MHRILSFWYECWLKPETRGATVAYITMQGLKIGYYAIFLEFFEEHKHSMPLGGTTPESRARSTNQEQCAK